MKKFYFLFASVVFSSIAQADLESRIEEIKETIKDVKCHVHYYAPYAVASTVGLTGFSVGPKFGTSVIAALGLYSLYATYQGYKEIKTIEKKYKMNTKVADYWNSFYDDETFLFCRWRQQDDRYGDGYYWPTAWLCNEERYEVRKRLIHDINAQRIEVVMHGKKIGNPKPSQVITAINHELNELEKDKKRLQAYTNVYRGVEQPESFHPDTSSWRILWPNYNRASKLYIELVQMMKRLEVLRDIVAAIRAEVAADKWPRA